MIRMRESLNGIAADMKIGTVRPAKSGRMQGASTGVAPTRL